jgi:Protein tyrosine and serine/threonine kinase
MAIRIEESLTRGIEPEPEPVKSGPTQRMLHKLHRFLRRDGSPEPCSSPQPATNESSENQPQPARRDFSRRVGVGLPRPGTFRRQNSERRERLEPVEPCPQERRAVSAHKQNRAVSAYGQRSRPSPPPRIPSQLSAPSLPLSNGTSDQPCFTDHAEPSRDSTEPSSFHHGTTHQSMSPYRSSSPSPSEISDELALDDKAQIDLELDTKWILNLSMHFRDKSDREKFFITFAEKPNRWRRVTISCDYRNAEPDSLEMDLKELPYQRDKNSQIYESIRDSLSSIQFYNTVTNLKLQTEDNRLHVHVTEDVNEIIPYPPRRSVHHIIADRLNPIREARECDINFLSHLSGFVYKVSFDGRNYIKKEIPGPDTVDEFLYEVNALHALSAATSVIKLEAIVMDDSRQTVKGLLISYAERGALVDILYDDQKGEIPWTDRMRWARQAIEGLSEIHEEGYVQGDFTLSNIVINSKSDAKIIDINRRGCPVGWEPPEIANKIASNQRISMYIGQKSDLYQLGMSLWGLAMGEDEPERHDQPLSMEDMPNEVPYWFKEIVSACLSPQPRDRPSAKELLRRFPLLPSDHVSHQISPVNGQLDERSPKRYIEPCAAVEREDLERLGRRRWRSRSQGPLTEDASLIEPASSSYQFGSGSSVVDIRRGRQAPTHGGDAQDHESAHTSPDSHDVHAWCESDLAPRIISVSPGREPRYLGIDMHAASDVENPVSALPESFSYAQDQPSGQTPNSAAEMTQTVPCPLSAFSEVHHEPACQAPDADLELPSPHQSPPDAPTTSLTSDSTPRNAPSMMATSMSSIVPPLPLDLAAADLAGLGGHPSLEEYSPHEPMKTSDVQSSQNYNNQTQQQHFAASTDVFVCANDPRPLDTVEPPGNVISTDKAKMTAMTTLPEPTKFFLTSAAEPDEKPREKKAQEQKLLGQEIQEKQVQETAAQERKPEEQKAEEEQPQEKYVQEQQLQEQRLEEQPPHDQEPRQRLVQEHSPQEQPPQGHQLQELPLHEQPPQEQPPKEQPPKEQPPKEQSPKEQPPKEQPPKEQQEQPPKEQPPKEQPPKEQPPKEQPPKEQPPKEQQPQEQPPQEQPPKAQPPQEHQPWEQLLQTPPEKQPPPIPS